MSDNRERLRDEIKQTAGQHDPDSVGSILTDLADYLNDTAGEFSDKALAEIASAYLQGMRDSVGYADGHMRDAQRALMPLIPAIGRVR